MIKIISSEANADEIIALVKSRHAQADDIVTARVRTIIEDVSKRGDEAVLRYTKRLDGVDLDSMEVSTQEIDEAYRGTDRRLLSAMQTAAENIRSFHKRQLQSSWSQSGSQGIIVGQKVLPLERVAMYVPGGRTAYPSSVLMSAIPAKVAGVSDLFMLTPPNKQGKVAQNILAAAKIAGVDKIYKVGGAQGIAAAAYGTETIKRADKIVGPGNIYVATAKRFLYGIVDIDMVAGPSEILIIADDRTDPAYAAADLLSQAEHDPMASAIMLCMSREQAEATAKEVERQAKTLRYRETIEKSLSKYSRIVVCSDMEECIALANEIAPEHLELLVDNPGMYWGRIKNAGTVFFGRYTPESVGDYIAGPSHVLPTGGSARFFSGLCVESFTKRINVIYYSKQALENSAKDIITFANAECFDGHANAVAIRLKGDKKE